MNIEDRLATNMGSVHAPAAAPTVPASAAGVHDQHGDTPANHSAAYANGKNVGFKGDPMVPPFGYQMKDLAAWNDGWAAGFAELTGGSAAVVATPIFAGQVDKTLPPPAPKINPQPNPKYEAGIADVMQGLPKKPNASAEYNRGYDDAARQMDESVVRAVASSRAGAGTDIRAFMDSHTAPKSQFMLGKESAQRGDTFNALASEEFKAGWKQGVPPVGNSHPEIGMTLPPPPAVTVALDRSTFPAVEPTAEAVEGVQTFFPSAGDVGTGKPIDELAASLATARKEHEAGWYAAARGEDLGHNCTESFRDGFTAWHREYERAGGEARPQRRVPQRGVTIAEVYADLPHLDPRAKEPNKLGQRVDKLYNLLEFAWAIIANAGGGNWDTETEVWRETAGRFRDKYHAAREEVTMPAANPAGTEHVLEIKLTGKKADPMRWLTGQGFMEQLQRAELWLKCANVALSTEGTGAIGKRTSEIYADMCRDVG